MCLSCCKSKKHDVHFGLCMGEVHSKIKCSDFEQSNISHWIRTEMKIATSATAILLCISPVSSMGNSKSQVVQSRLRAVRRDHTNAAGTIVSTLQGGNLYVGIETKLLQTVLTSAFMLLIYEKIVGTVASGIKLFMFLLYFLCNHIWYLYFSRVNYVNGWWPFKFIYLDIEQLNIVYTGSSIARTKNYKSSHTKNISVLFEWGEF